MVDITTPFFVLLGAGFFWLYEQFQIRRNKAFFALQQAVKKKQAYGFLETSTGSYFRTLTKIRNNIGITPQKEVIILPEGSLKPVMNMGGQIFHADLYKSIATNQEFRKFLEERTNDKWTEEDVAKFLQEVEQTPANILSEFFKKLKTDPYYPNTNPVDQAKITKVDRQKFQIFKSLSSEVKNFIYTGINRTSIHSMLKELVYQRELENVGKRNWIAIAIAAFIIVMIIVFALNTLGGSGGGVANLVGGILPNRVNP